jgi:hypothetical protein
VTAGDPSGTPEPSTGRVVALYLALRLLLFLVAWLLLALLGVKGFLAPAAAVLLSSLAALVVLRRQREAVTLAVAARAGRRDVGR